MIPACLIGHFGRTGVRILHETQPATYRVSRAAVVGEGGIPGVGGLSKRHPGVERVKRLYARAIAGENG